jgi:hypothetical protein
MKRGSSDGSRSTIKEDPMLFTRKFSRLLPVGAIAALALVAAPAASAAITPVPCASNATEKVFSQFGDDRDYYLAPGGSFEGSITWFNRGPVSLVAGNEPWYLAGTNHSSAVRLQRGATLISPVLCVTRDEPYLRFMAKSEGTGSLHVTVFLFSASNKVLHSSSMSAGDFASWAPSGLIDLQTSKLPAGESGYIAVALRSQGDWTIDDVFVDPYRS